MSKNNNRAKIQAEFDSIVQSMLLTSHVLYQILSQEDIHKLYNLTQELYTIVEYLRKPGDLNRVRLGKMLFTISYELSKLLPYEYRSELKIGHKK